MAAELPSHDGRRPARPSARERQRRTQQRLAARHPKKVHAPLGPTGGAIGFGVLAFVAAQVTRSYLALPDDAHVTWEPTAGAVGTLVCLVLSGLCVAARRSEGRPRRIARRYRGQDRYVCPLDLGPDERDLVVRAARAVEAVRTSRAHARGLIDDQRNEVELPHLLWKIAFDSARMSALGREHRAAERSSAGADVDTVLKTQAKALKQSHKAINKRVKALEAYAESTARIDALLAQQSQLRAAERRNDAYLDLVATTASDTLGTERVHAARQDADALTDPLAAAVRGARDAAELALPTDAPAKA